MDIDKMEAGREMDVLDCKPYKCRSCGGASYRIWGKKEPRRYCVDCHRKNQKSSYARNAVETRKRRNERYVNKGLHRKWQMKFRYGITLDEYDKLNKKQNGYCAICGGLPDKKTKTLCVDHDHETGIVRGLLCNNCNIGLANFQDNTELLKKAINYLEDANE